jgi:hypothetical protein
LWLWLPGSPFPLPSIRLLLTGQNRLVRTPLWTDHPDKIKQFGYTTESSISPEEVAQAMIELCTDGKYGGGTCLETSTGGNRILGTWNIAEPASAGTAVPKEAIKMNQAPIRAIMDKEKGTQRFDRL